MEIIIKYFVDAIKAILTLFGVELDETFTSNLESMVGGLKDFKPETESGSVSL